MLAGVPETGSLLAGDKLEYRLGGLIAEGGEGRVFDVSGRDDVVAKIYKELDYTRDEKLRLLIGASSKGLRKVAAWPLSTLQDADTTTVGFVMESLKLWHPLHAVYQIRSRLKLFPTRNYSFLVRAARNLATCVHHVHDAGLVIGDLNESNVLVNNSAMVKLIDVDSFQVPGPTMIHPCKVGKSELLPPELQNHSLEGIVRTPEQDRFALAVLIFETLVYGRHPYSGKSTEASEQTLEESISKSYYPYSKRRPCPTDAPKHLSLEWLPPRIQDMFEDAFDPKVDRPTAKEWYMALKDLELNLRGCSDNPSHSYWNGCDRCPWCRLESKWNVALYRPVLMEASEEAIVDEIWERLEAIPSPALPHPPRVEFKVESLTPAVLSVWHKIALLTPYFTAAILFGCIFFFGTKSILLWPLLALFLQVWPMLLGSSSGYRVRRAKKKLRKLYERWQVEASPELFSRERKKYLDLCSQLKDTRGRFEAARQRAIQAIYQDQVSVYLRKFSILYADAGGVSSDKLASLYDAGVETAADLSVDVFMKATRSFSREERDDLLRWKRSLEAQFWRTSPYKLKVGEEREIILKIRKENQAIRKELEAAPAVLEAESRRLELAQAAIDQEAAQSVAELEKHGPRLLAFTAQQRSPFSRRESQSELKAGN